jgi:DNA-binding LacI/PurR family transcriptional regulator
MDQVRVDPSAPVPLATQLSQQLTWLIAGGGIGEGDHLPAIRDLAALLDINLHTVRAAYQQLDTAGLISMRQGRRATVLRYDRARAAATTADLPTFSIGAIIPGFVPFYAPMIRGIEAAAAQHPALVFICNAGDDPDTAGAYLDRLVARGVDGIVVAGPLLPPDVGFSGGPPLVFVDSPGAPGPSVEFDLRGSQFAATRHLIDHGHCRIGYLTAPPENRNVAPKYAAHQAALAAADRVLDPDLVAAAPDFRIASGEAETHRLLDLTEPPTAIAASSDSLAFGAFHAITARGLRVPEDVALVGNDDIDMAAVIRPALTTVSLPVEEAGRRAVAMLRELMAGQQPDPPTVVLDVELVVRESCGCA